MKNQFSAINSKDPLALILKKCPSFHFYWITSYLKTFKFLISKENHIWSHLNSLSWKSAVSAVLGYYHPWLMRDSKELNESFQEHSNDLSSHVLIVVTLVYRTTTRTSATATPPPASATQPPDDKGSSTRFGRKSQSDQSKIIPFSNFRALY